MATADSIKTITVTAGAAVPIYRFVQLQSDGKFDPVGTAQARADGISAQAAAADLDVFAMAIPDGSKMKVEAGAAVSVGAEIASDNVGRAIAKVAAVGNFRHGVAMTAAGAAGEIIEILFQAPSEDGGAS